MQHCISSARERCQPEDSPDVTKYRVASFLCTGSYFLRVTPEQVGDQAAEAYRNCLRKQKTANPYTASRIQRKYGICLVSITDLLIGKDNRLQHR